MEVQAGKGPARSGRPLTARITMLAMLLATMASLAGCGGNPVAPSAPPPLPVNAPSAAPGKVAIISIDGLRPDALLTVGAPNILTLADRGAYSWQAQTVMPSTTLPSHISMLSGFPPEVHGIVWDDYIKERGPIPVPTLFGVARSLGRRTAVMAGKHKFTYFCEGPGRSDVCTITSNGDDEVTSGAVSSRAVDLLFVHLPDVDVNGHRSGWMSDAYLTAVRQADVAYAGDTVRVAAEISQHPPQAVELAGEGGGFGKRRELSEEAQLTGHERRLELGE